ncbi:MAG: lysophospholipid acyltransferase family protein [Planctomycetota bacterium]
MIYWLMRALSRLLCRIWLRNRSQGSEYLPEEGGFLIAVNHCSHLDPLLCGTEVQRPLYFLARRSLFRPAAVGWFLRAVHAVPIDRERFGKGAFRQVLDRLAGGGGVLVFPEGTRSADGKLGRLKSGVVRLAQSAAVPVIPAWIEGSFRAMGRGRRFPRPVRTEVRFGRPMRFDPGDDPESGLQELRQRLLSLGGKVAGEAPATETDGGAP